MTFLDKVGNKVEHMKSKQSENSEVSSITKKIKELDDQSDIILSEIALYYWNQYARGDLVPPVEIEDKFKAVERNNIEVIELNKKIESVREAGEAQRKQIDEETERKIAQREAEAAERKRQREEAKLAAAEQKAAEKAAKAESMETEVPEEPKE